MLKVVFGKPVRQRCHNRTKPSARQQRKAAANLASRPQWDSTNHDLAAHRATKEDLLERKLQHMSRHNIFGWKQLGDELLDHPANPRIQKKMLRKKQRKKKQTEILKNCRAKENVPSSRVAETIINNQDDTKERYKNVSNKKHKEKFEKHIKSVRSRAPLQSVCMNVKNGNSLKVRKACKTGNKSHKRDTKIPDTPPNGIKFAFGKRIDIHKTVPRQISGGGHPWIKQTSQPKLIVQYKKMTNMSLPEKTKKLCEQKKNKIKENHFVDAVSCIDEEAEIREFERRTQDKKKTFYKTKNFKNTKSKNTEISNQDFSNKHLLKQYKTTKAMFDIHTESTASKKEKNDEKLLKEMTENTENVEVVCRTNFVRNSLPNKTNTVFLTEDTPKETPIIIDLISNDTLATTQDYFSRNTSTNSVEMQTTTLSSSKVEKTIESKTPRAGGIRKVEQKSRNQKSIQEPVCRPALKMTPTIRPCIKGASVSPKMSGIFVSSMQSRRISAMPMMKTNPFFSAQII